MSLESEDQLPVSKPIRLQRFLAQCGLGSRRECEELIVTGRIDIDGEVVTQLGTSVEPQRQTVRLDGERLRLERKKYFMLNKPAGYLCTAKDPQGRPVVLDLFPDEGPRLFTVGRLDENTTGLLIVTNDGDLAQKLAHPRHRIFRFYRAQVAGSPTPEIVEQLQQGLYFTEGKFRVHAVKLMKKQKGSTWVDITMTEGQNREIRRLFARVGHKIMKLERFGFGPLRLSRVKPGEYRELRREELGELHEVLEKTRTSQQDRIEYGTPENPEKPRRMKPPGKPDPARQRPAERPRTPERSRAAERSRPPERSRGPGRERTSDRQRSSDRERMPERSERQGPPGRKGPPKGPAPKYSARPKTAARHPASGERPPREGGESRGTPAGRTAGPAKRSAGAAKRAAGPAKRAGGPVKRAGGPAARARGVSKRGQARHRKSRRS